MLMAGYAWIGASDASVEGVFTWSDGSVFNYTNWADGEPNNLNVGGEDYAVLDFDNGGKWNDVQSGTFLATKHQFLCRYFFRSMKVFEGLRMCSFVPYIFRLLLQGVVNLFVNGIITALRRKAMQQELRQWQPFRPFHPQEPPQLRHQWIQLHC